MSFTVLITLPYYFISLQHTLYQTFLFLSIIFIISTLIICIFYCLKYTSLLLRLIITHFINAFYDNYVINICSRQLLWFVQVSLIFVLISWLQKDHSMMETRRLKNVIFFPNNFNFCAVKKNFAKFLWLFIDNLEHVDNWVGCFY